VAVGQSVLVAAAAAGLLSDFVAVVVAVEDSPVDEPDEDGEAAVLVALEEPRLSVR
jgi:hypothetical protein